MKRILFLAPHPPGVSASQRFRFEHYLGKLKSYGYSYDYASFLDLKTWKIFFKPGNFLQKVTGIIRGYIKRVFLLSRLRSYDFIFIHREAAPVGPPFLEWWISKIAGKKIIYDFDDAIWINVASKSNPGAGLVKWTGKVKSICRYANKVSVGNQYLADFAVRYNRQVTVVPTVVDTVNVHSPIKQHQATNVTIGWTGTFTNFPYLLSIIPVIKELQAEFFFRFLIIADMDPAFENVSYEFLKWNKQTEIEDLLKFDIGLMPLPDIELARGKCAFKAIQYMALGIPAVVSNVGANRDVVDHGVNGFVCVQDSEWKQTLQLLLRDEKIRSNMGAKARKKIEDHYSVLATQELFVSLFNT